MKPTWIPEDIHDPEPDEDRVAREQVEWILNHGYGELFGLEEVDDGTPYFFRR